MELKNIFTFDIEWNYKTISLFIILLGLPNLLGMLNISTVWGFKIHFFQIAVFFAAFIYGPLGGAFSGAAGSIYSAFAISNPYIIIGNIILGFFAGLFFRYGIWPVVAVLFAFIIQLPWLWISDVYLAHMPLLVVKGVIIALLISNTIWAVIAGYASKPLRNIIENGQ